MLDPTHPILTDHRTMQHTPHEDRLALAAAIEERRREIEHRWREKMTSALAARGRRISDAALAPAVAEYLEALSAQLRREPHVPAAGAAAWKALSGKHALTRVSAGFDLDGLLNEFVTLRKAITFEIDAGRSRDAAARTGNGKMTTRQLDMVSDLIDAALREAINSYVDHRDYQVRQLRADQIGFVTHELRNPLTTAMVGASRLRAGGLAGDGAQAADLVERNLKRVANLIDTFLLAERVEAGSIRPQPVDVPVGQLIDQALTIVRPAATSRGVAVEVDIDPTVVIHADPALTVSALASVLVSAVSFCDRGVVTVDAEDARTAHAARPRQM